MIIKRDPKVGRFVIADKSYPKNSILSVSECIPLKGLHMPRFSTGSPLWSYVFNGKTPGVELVALDWTSLMNHSDDPNVIYEPINDLQIEFRALKDINEGDELNINYGYDPLRHTQALGADMNSWNQLTAFDGNMAASQGGVENSMVSMVSKPDFEVLSRIRKNLEDAPRDTKRAFNAVLSYFEGKCPETGCIEQDSEGNWRIISNKTGEYWKPKYKSKDSAEAALRAYHASRG